jgi:hypothetical protein
MRKYALILLLILIFFQPVSAYTVKLNISETAKLIYQTSPNETIFIERVNNFVNNPAIFTYETVGGDWSVSSPEITWSTRKGDCSEFSLLKAELLKSQGIDARVVYGYLNGILHDEVEIHKDHYFYYLTKEHFVKMGDGLHPQEYYDS